MSSLTRLLSNSLRFRFSVEKVYSRREYQQIKKQEEPSQPIPKSPVMGPILVENPKVSNKTYRWCACGGSKTQPFCDGSHHGTPFKPYRFTVEQETKSIQLCGCKLTSNKPFCDGQSCKQ